MNVNQSSKKTFVQAPVKYQDINFDALEQKRNARVKDISVKLVNAKIEADKLRKKIAAKVAKNDRKCILLTEKLAQLEMKTRQWENEVFGLIG